MKTKLQLLTILTISALIIPVMALAQSSPPSIPLLVYGSVEVDGSLAPVGAIITAEIEDKEVANTTVTIQGRYSIDVPDGSVNEGKMIKFKVIGIADDANQCESLNVATNPIVYLDLSVISPVSPPPAPPVSSGGSSSGGSSTPSPVSPLSAAAQVVDTNGDDKIDILDFNSLVINWGKTGSGNVADFDNNGTVDIFDFNLLMTYWTGQVDKKL